MWHWSSSWSWGKGCDPARPEAAGGKSDSLGVNALRSNVALESPAQVLPPSFSASFHLLRIVLPDFLKSLPDFSCWADLHGHTVLLFPQHPGLCCRLKRAALPGTQAVPASSKSTSRESWKTSACYFNITNLHEIQVLVSQQNQSPCSPFCPFMLVWACN